MVTQAAATVFDADIAIVGGGMVGLSLAKMLAHSNSEWRIAVIESFPFKEAEPLYQPSFDSRSSAIAYGSCQLFEQLGLWQRLNQHATPVKKVHVSDKGHIGGSKMTAEEYSVDALGYVIDNQWLGQCLFEAVQPVANIEIMAPNQVAELTAIDKGYELVLSPGEGSDDTRTLKTRLLILSDGIHSNLKQKLGIAVDSTDYHSTAIISNVEFSQAHQGVAYERFTSTGPMAILPRGESTRANQGALIWTLPPDKAKDIAELDETAFLACLQKSFGDRVGRFTRVGSRHLYPLKLVQVKEQIRSHLAVMGNAAHALHPVAGQGFNLSMRDCALMTEVLNQAWREAPDSFGCLKQLQTYMDLRSRDQFTTIQFSHWLPKLFSTSQLASAAFRGLGLLGLELFPVGKKQLALQSMGKVGRSARL
ncbi:2-octaprenyl-6-methoxyphenyl hydroxylase [Sessilibacter sp. MAH4]